MAELIIDPDEESEEPVRATDDLTPQEMARRREVILAVADYSNPRAEHYRSSDDPTWPTVREAAATQPTKEQHD